MNSPRQARGEAFHERRLKAPAAPRTPAVMQQRGVSPDELDYFPTPPWAVRAICETLIQLGQPLSRQTCWEPAAGEMHMANPLAEYFGWMLASDVHDYGCGCPRIDFLDAAAEPPECDWIVTNPPFLKGADFVERALPIAKGGVAMFVRGAFTEGEKRFERLYRRDRRPAYVFTFVERVVCLRARLIRAGALDPFNFDAKSGEPRKASTATSYALMVWLPGEHDTRHRWIAPCRTRLEREGDYPAYAEQWEALNAYQAELSAEAGQGALQLSSS